MACDGASTKLTMGQGVGPEETVVEVEGQQGYENVFRLSGQSAAVVLRGVNAKEGTAATVSADLNAGPEPIQSRLDGIDHGYLGSQRVYSGCSGILLPPSHETGRRTRCQG